MIGTSLLQRARETSVLTSPPSPLRLRIRLVNGKKRIVRTSAAKCTIGTHPDCMIRIPGKLETGVHCILLRSRAKVVARSWSEDCTINGRKFEIANLKAGDTLRVAGASIRILRDRKEKIQRKKAEASSALFGKRLVREIGTRLAHLEERLVKRQRSLTKQMAARSAKSKKTHATVDFAAPPSKPVELAPSPMVVEGLNTLRCAVEELRTQVDEVALRPWPTPSPSPAIDAEALIESASARVGEVIHSSIRQDRTQTALKFEQIGQEFDRIGDRLGEVEQKLSLPSVDLITERVRPVCEAVDFIRTGIQAIEDRQALDASRFAEFSNGLASLSQTTMERLGEVSNKIAALPDLSSVELSLAAVSKQVDGISREIAHRHDLYVTREDIASLMKQFESSNEFQSRFEDRFVAIDERFDGMLGEWSRFQAGTEDQLRVIAQRIDALPTSSLPAIVEQVDLAPLGQKIGECRLELADHALAISSLGESQQACGSRIDAVSTSIEHLQSEFNSQRIDGERIDTLESTVKRIQAEVDSYQVFGNRIDAVASSIEQVQAEVNLQRNYGERIDAAATSIEKLQTEVDSHRSFSDRIDATVASIEQVQLEIEAHRSYGDRIDQLTAEAASERARTESSIEQSRTAQQAFVEQLLALENRCVHLEGELARLASCELAEPGVRASATQATSAGPVQEEPVEGELAFAASEPPYSNSYMPEAVVTPAEAQANDNSYLSNEESTEEYELAQESDPAPSSLSDSAQFAALKRAAVLSRPAIDETSNINDESEGQNQAELSEEYGANVPNSVVASLRRSGIWKEAAAKAAAEAAAASESPEDPRDIVGSAYQADSTPPTGVDPGKHPAEQLHKKKWNGPHPVGAEDEEESIDAYMERLMQRVTGGTGEVTGTMAVAEHLQRAKAHAPRRTKAPVDADDSEFEYTPKVAAPEKSADLTALRELAMTSANVNIQNYHAASKAKTANEKWVVVVVAMTCAMGLCYICVNYKSDWSFLAAGAAFMVALYWAIQASFSTVVAKRIAKNEPGGTVKDEKTASKVDVNLLRNVKKAQNEIEAPSAGETFKALVAERERVKTSSDSGDGSIGETT